MFSGLPCRRLNRYGVRPGRTYVLEDGAKAASDRVDLRFRIFGKSNHLGVAPVLEIEDAVVAPAMLIIANQVAVGVGGKGCLASAGESNKKMATSPSLPTLAEQCMGSTPSKGKRKFSTVKIVFFDFAGVIS